MSIEKAGRGGHRPIKPNGVLGSTPTNEEVDSETPKLEQPLGPPSGLLKTEPPPLLAPGGLGERQYRWTKAHYEPLSFTDLAHEAQVLAGPLPEVPSPPPGLSEAAGAAWRRRRDEALPMIRAFEQIVRHLREEPHAKEAQALLAEWIDGPPPADRAAALDLALAALARARSLVTGLPPEAGAISIEGPADVLPRLDQHLQKVAGRTLRGWPERRDAIAARHRALDAAMLELDAGGSGAASSAAALLGIPEAATWPKEMLSSAVQAEMARLRRLLAPVRVVVVPRDKHFSSMPHVADARGTLAKLLPHSRAAHVFAEEARFVFVPEDDVEGKGLSTRHELYHVLEQVWLPEEMTERIAAHYAKTKAKNGPWPTEYGRRPREFFPICGQIFEGALGDRGRAWLEAEHPALFELLVEVTGRRPGQRRRQAPNAGGNP